MDARNEGLRAWSVWSVLERIDARITAALWRDVDAGEQRQEEAGGTPTPVRGGAAKDPPGADPYAAPGLREVPTPVSPERSSGWVVVVSPRGDVVRLDTFYDQFEDGGSLFGLSLRGRLDDGTRVTVRGSHVALAWREVLLARFEPRLPSWVPTVESLRGEDSPSAGGVS